MPTPSRAPEPNRQATLPGIQQAVLAALGGDPAGLDTLCERTGAEVAAVAAALFELELAQYVERLPGNSYQRLR